MEYTLFLIGGIKNKIKLLELEGIDVSKYE